MSKNKYLLLVQLGTPDSLEKQDVSDYLSSFLMDPGAISLPYLLRFLLVKGIIVPRRTEKVIGRYSQIWDSQRGSPLKYHSEDLVVSLQNILQDEYEVRLAVLYGEPGLETVMKEITADERSSVTIMPMFPHETPATTGAVHRRIQRIVDQLDFALSIQWIPAFFGTEWFLKAFARKIVSHTPANFDRIIFSFHGLPLKQVNQAHPGKTCIDLDCHQGASASGLRCYTKDCYQTAHLLSKELNLLPEQVFVSFQSRFGRNWTSPHTSDVLNDFAEEGLSVLLVSPSFTADCLETSWEIGILFRDEFLKSGGKKFEWVQSLNADADWAEAISIGIR